MRFAKLLDQINIEREFSGPENTQVKIDKFYSLLEAITSLVFQKKKTLTNSLMKSMKTM